MKKINFAFLIALLGVLMVSCSMVKSPQSANFNRVKYNTHLKMAKPVELTKQEAFKTAVENEKKVENKALATNEEAIEQIEHETKLQASRVSSEQLKSTTKKYFQVKSTALKENSFKEKITIRSISENVISSPTSIADDWWEDDPENWPWKRIILFVIAFLVIALIVYLIVELLGGVVGGIVGLILLLLLIYLFYDKIV